MKKISLLILISFITISFSAKAQIIYSDLDPDILIDSWNVGQLDLDKDGSMDIDLWFHPWGADANIEAVSFKDIELLGDVDSNEFFPFAMEMDSLIESTGTEWQSINSKYVNLSKGGNKGHWIGKTEKYLAFRMKKSNQWYYGWIMLTVEGASLPTALVIHEFAWQSTPNKEIKAGDKGETSGIYASNQTNRKSGLIFNNQTSSLLIQYAGTEGKLTIYDMQGRSRLFINNFENGNQQIDLNSLESGIYIAVLKTYNSIQTLKFDKM